MHARPATRSSSYSKLGKQGEATTQVQTISPTQLAKGQRQRSTEMNQERNEEQAYSIRYTTASHPKLAEKY